MKKIIFTITIPIALISIRSDAQNAIFLSQGRIEFEKKVNLYAQIDDISDEAWRDLIKKTTPKFKTTYFNLFFNNDKTLYKPGRENPDNNNMFFDLPAENNTVFSDLKKYQAVSEKNIFDQKYLIQDSTRNIKWKITDEKRNIAGFDCRRANALIMDSIYIVAFYTDEITTTGGPESFSGLPGMILGLAIPHEHITWFATKVYAEDVPASSLAAPVKGKKTTNKSMLTELQDIFKNYGNWAKNFAKESMF